MIQTKKKSKTQSKNGYFMRLVSLRTRPTENRLYVTPICAFLHLSFIIEYTLLFSYVFEAQ